jgi:transcription-repair coupling factor (superfamily II helicase)
VQNYHGFAYSQLIAAGIRCGVQQLISTYNRVKPACRKKYDVLILDEYQDIDEDISKMLYQIKKMFPKAAILTGHGQMDGDILENIMLSFINNEADILISTTIIENGLDIPNANTIIVFDAQNFGLSELHQLRGRVGRSNRKAFCYLISPPEENLTVQARQRLRAIESFTELGSGFNIAMQDLDIRGAGNMLGGEQSGFINEIGIETYQKILDDAIAEKEP